MTLRPPRTERRACTPFLPPREDRFYENVPARPGSRLCDSGAGFLPAPSRRPLCFSRRRRLVGDLGKAGDAGEEGFPAAVLEEWPPGLREFSLCCASPSLTLGSRRPGVTLVGGGGGVTRALGVAAVPPPHTHTLGVLWEKALGRAGCVL